MMWIVLSTRKFRKESHRTAARSGHCTVRNKVRWQKQEFQPIAGLKWGGFEEKRCEFSAIRFSLQLCFRTGRFASLFGFGHIFSPLVAKTQYCSALGSTSLAMVQFSLHQIRCFINYWPEWVVCRSLDSLKKNITRVLHSKTNRRGQRVAQ